MQVILLEKITHLGELGAVVKVKDGYARNFLIPQGHAKRATKAAINTGLEQPMDEAIVTEEKLFGSCFETEDQKAGMANFLEKDKAKKLKVVPYQGK